MISSRTLEEKFHICARPWIIPYVMQSRFAAVVVTSINEHFHHKLTFHAGEWGHTAGCYCLHQRITNASLTGWLIHDLNAKQHACRNTRKNFDAQTVKRINDILIDLFSLYVLNSQYKTTRWYSADHFRLKLNHLHVHMYAHNYKTRSPARAYVCTKSQNFIYCTCLCRRKIMIWPPALAYIRAKSEVTYDVDTWKSCIWSAEWNEVWSAWSSQFLSSGGYVGQRT